MFSLKAISWNCHSIANKKSEFSKFIENNNIKISFLSETWLNDKSNVSFPHHSLYRADRSRGGSAILIHNSVPHTFVKKISLDFAEAVLVKIHDSTRDITIASIYCSPNATRTQANLFFSKILSVTGPSIISGDFNAKHNSWNNTNSCRKGTDLNNICHSRRFKIHSPDGPTLTPYRGLPSCVDFVISKNILGVTNPKVSNELSSDHLPISFSIPLSSCVLKDIRILNYRKANWKKFQNLMIESTKKLDSRFPNIDSKRKIDECISSLEDEVRQAMVKSVPKKLPYKFRYPFSDEINRLVKCRNSYRNKFIRTGDSFFRSVVSQINNMIKNATNTINRESFDLKVENLNIYNQSLYQFAKSLKNKSTASKPLQTGGTSLAYSNQAKANALAAAFAHCHRVSSNLKSNKENQVKKSVDKLAKDKDPQPSSPLVRDKEVSEIIKYLNIKKTPGHDRIPNRVIKCFPPVTVSLLTRIFNSCIKTFYFPIAWKIGKVASIPKPGKDHAVPSNFRPISLLSNIGKIFEKILLEQLSCIELKNKIFIPEQFGFRSSHSTIHQVIRLTEKISINFNKNRSSGMVLLDIEKAFDSVWHDGLLHKLLSLKFPIWLVKIIQSYLSDRKSFVDFKGSHSDTYEIPAGVPQGSILAPFLFNIFINDIKHPKRCDVAIFADDTAIHTDTTWKNIKTIKSNLEKALEQITEYFNSWKIKINEGKTEFIVFSKSRVMNNKLPHNLPVFNNQTFAWQEHVKYLGAHLDNKLNFRKHIEISVQKANKTISTLFCIFRRKSTASTHSKLMIYKAYIRPILTYAGTMLQNCPKTHFNRLQVMQNKCLRMALNAPFRTRTADLHNAANIPYIREFIDKNANNFYEKAQNHDNELIKHLGDYSKNTLPFRVKHRLPRAV